MAGQSIGSMFVDLEARTAKLEDGLNKAKKELEKFTREGRDAASSTKGLFSDLDMAILATSVKLRIMYESWRLINQEVAYAWKNIETIGISPEAVQSVQLLKSELEDLNDVARKVFGEMLGDMSGKLVNAIQNIRSFPQYMEAIKNFLKLGPGRPAEEHGALWQESLDKAFSGGVDLSTVDAETRARILDPSYVQKLDTISSRINEAMRKESMAVLDVDAKYAKLSEQEAVWRRGAETGTTLLMKQEHRLNAINASIEKGNIQRQHENTVRSMQTALSIAQEREQLKELDNAEKLIELSKRKAELGAVIPSGMLDEQRLLRERLAVQLDLNAAVDANRARDETIISLTRMRGDEQLRQSRSLITDSERLKQLRSELVTIDREYNAMVRAATIVEAGKESVVVRTKEMVENRQRALQVERELVTVLPKVQAYWRDAANILASGFEKAILSGGKLRDMLKGIANDLLALMIRQTVTMPIANSLTKGLTAFGATLGFAADGGPIPSGMPYIVGERGPELFIPSSSGTIVPNHAMSSGGGGNSYYIDARGADEARIAQLERTIIGLHATVERRAVAAVVQGNRRRGGLGMALAGA